MADRSSELDRARSVQAAMLPPAPELPGLEIATSYRACEHVGGDFYDFVSVDPWHLGFVMADVSGHGTAAALVMAAAKKTLQMCGRGCLSPRETLLAANDHLAREIPRGMFVSVFYGVLDIRDHAFTFARAGHNPLLVLRSGGELEALSPGGSVLGVMASSQLSARLEEASVNLNAGDLVVVYTDGLTEALNPHRQMWGDARFREALGGLGGAAASEAMSRLLKQVDEFREGHPQNDDEALVLIRPVETDAEPTPLKGDSDLPETNLPPHATNLIGRDVEVSELLALVSDADAGVISVVGTAGIGKTRVALGAASLALGVFQAGVWHADLADVEDAEGVSQQIGESLGVDLSSGDAADRIGLALQGRTRSRNGRLLLILDNADQCRGAVAELVAQWRALAREITVLVTCRAALGVSGERVFSVRPLGVPVRKKTERIEVLDDAGLRKLARMPSVELFVARARERDARFELTKENADAVGQLCVRLDGIPLAIELAAARAKVLSPQKMMERLNQRFALLRDQRGTSSRQSTLRGAIEWSWELLDEGERETLAQLAVLRGGFFLELAEEVVNLDHMEDAPFVMDVVESLHDKSLLDSMELAKLGGERRFNMFESIRAFALEQLHKQGRAEATEQRWRETLTEYAKQWHAKSSSDESRLRLQLELEALSEIARGAGETACWAALIAGPMLQRLGSPNAARDILKHAADRCDDPELKSRLNIAYALALVHIDPAGAEKVLGNVPQDSPLYIEAILALGQTYQNRGNGKMMAELLHGLEQRDDLSPLHRGRISAGLGNASLMTGDVNGGLEYYLKTLDIAHEINDAVLEGQVTGNIGVVYNMKGDPVKALEYFNKALNLMQAQEHQIAEAYWLVNIAGIHEHRNELDDAETKLTRALKLGRENGLREVTAAALGALAAVTSMRGHYEEALDLAQQALDIDEEMGNERGKATHMTQQMQILQKMGRMDEYEAGLKEIIALGEKTGDRVIVAERSGDLGKVEADRALASGDKALLQQAADRLRESIETLEQLGAGRSIGGRVALAETLIGLEQNEEAAAVLKNALEFEPHNDEEQEVLESAKKLQEQLDGNGTAD
ncbi:MAG: SpoIIE family protein phosphatase [Planctomycetes bacterium]|nr:SpoIIE family protein phosphatase [Planctomycetota bacterium]